VHEPVAFDGFADAPWNAMSHSMQDSYVADKAAQLSNACDGAVGHALLSGDVEEEISKRAHDVHADMIVMCSHGYTGLTRVLAGSVADGVIRQSHIPVLLLRPTLPGAATRTPPLDFQTILIPIDASPQSREILDSAIALASQGHTRFVVLHVVAPVLYVVDGDIPHGYVSGPLDETATNVLIAEAERDVGDTAAEIGRRSRCEVDHHVVVSENAGAAIADHASKSHADLIAMTTHGRGMSRLLLGSVTDAVLRSSSVPMLLLRPART
jgi:nucleotide-binding universal stress UspA family protein